MPGKGNAGDIPIIIKIEPVWIVPQLCHYSSRILRGYENMAA